MDDVIITVNLSTGKFLLIAFAISQKRKADSESEKTVSSEQPAQKKM